MEISLVMAQVFFLQICKYIIVSTFIDENPNVSLEGRKKNSSLIMLAKIIFVSNAGDVDQNNLVWAEDEHS